MKIKIIQDISLPKTFYKKGAILDSSNHGIDSKEEYERLYKMFIDSGYAVEIVELQNNYKEDDIYYVICNTCKNSTNPINKCEKCKYFQNIDLKKHINQQVINIIKSQ